MTSPPADLPLRPLGAYLLDAAARWPGTPHLQAFHGDGRLETATFAETAGRASAIARRLIAAGLAPGAGVAVLGDPSPLQVEATFGVWLAGGVLTPLDPQWDPAAHGRALRKAGIAFGLATPGRVEALTAAARLRPGFTQLDAAEAAGGPRGGPPLPAVDLAARALILFTSGTTGEPKGVVQLHRALAWNAAATLGTIDAGHGDNMLSVLPLHHIFGLIASVIVPAFGGATVTFPPSLRGPDVTRTMRETGITIVAAVPQLMLGLDRGIQAKLAAAPAAARALVALLAAIVRAGRGLGVNLGPLLFRRVHAAIAPRLRFLGSAGAALDPVAARRLWSLGFNLIEGYGLTESGPAISFDRVEAPRFGTVGFPLRGVELRILEPDEKGTGEIAVRSPSVFEGYLDDPEETELVLRQGWLHTGDIGRLDPDGRLVITGRRKEVIVLGSGKNVYPHEVEARLDESAFVKESCVVGLAEGGRRGTDKLHAVIVPDLEAFRAAGQSRIEVTLRDELNRIGDQLPSHHRVVGLTVRQEPLPRTALGKLKRFQVLAEIEQERLHPARPAERPAAAEPEPESPAWLVVRDALASVAAKGTTIRPSSGIELDLGLDSLARVEALAALEEGLGTRLPEGFGAEAITASDLLEMVERQLESGETPSGFHRMAAGTADAELRSLPRRLARPFGLVLTMLLWPVVWLAARLGWGFHVHGREHLPAGAYLVCPNHGSYVDAVIVVLAMPLGARLRLWALGDRAVFGGPIMRLVSVMANVIRVHPGAGLKATLEAGGAVLRSGRPLVLFPEGARAPEGERLVFRRGAAILARTLDVPIVPTWLEGVDRLLPRGAAIPRLGHRVAVRFGAPIPPHATGAAHDPAAALTELVRERVLELGAAEAAEAVAHEA